MKLLIVSNMGAKPSSPMQGIFVDNQVSRLGRTDDVSYHFLKWNGDSLLHKIFKYPYFFISFIFKYIISFHKFKVIHVHYYFPTIIIAFIYKVLRNPKVKIIVTCHGSDIYSYPQPNYLYKYFTTIVNHWIFTSEKLKSRFYKELSEFECSVISAGFDDEVFKSKKVNAKKKILDFLFIGHLDQNKGVDRLIYLIKELPECNFGIIGSGEQSIDLLNLEKKVSNLAIFGSLSQPQIVKHLQTSKFLLSLSRKESFGLVMSEANACGVPCICTETDGSVEQYGDNELMIKQTGLDESEIRNRLLDRVNFALSLDVKTYNEACLSSQVCAQRYSLTYTIKLLQKIYQEVPSESLKSH